MNETAEAVTVYVGPSESSDTKESPESVDIAEHDASRELALTEGELRFLQSLEKDTGVLSLEHTATGATRICSSSYVGVASLPSGRRIEVTPKETVSRLLDLLQYALDVPTDTIQRETELSESTTFIDSFAALFQTKLRQLLDRGIQRSYTRVQGVEPAVRGRLDVQRQLQRPTPVPTDFAVEYDTLTANTTSNQAILAATQVLVHLVNDDMIASSLNRQEQRLRQFIDPAHVTVADIEGIQTNRLNAYYDDLLTLSKLVLGRRFFEDITTGDVGSFGFFIDMNTIYEAVVERAMRETAARVDSSWTVKGQGSLAPLIDGVHAVNMRPDVVVHDATGEVILVADAKWKTSTESPSDIYQLTSYMLSEEAPGLLIYPEQGTKSRSSKVRSAVKTLELRSVFLPTATDPGSRDEYFRGLESYLASYLEDLQQKLHSR